MRYLLLIFLSFSVFSTASYAQRLAPIIDNSDENAIIVHFGSYYTTNGVQLSNRDVKRKLKSDEIAFSAYRKAMFQSNFAYGLELLSTLLLSEAILNVGFFAPELLLPSLAIGGGGALLGYILYNRAERKKIKAVELYNQNLGVYDEETLKSPPSLININ